MNTLIALADREHTHHELAAGWFRSAGRSGWGVCAFTEAGFLRVVTRAGGGRPLEAATEILARFSKHPGYRYWPLSAGWATLAAPFRGRLFGHQQITDAYLLGLAVKKNGVLVSMDKGLIHLAGSQYRHNLLILE